MKAAFDPKFKSLPEMNAVNQAESPEMGMTKIMPRKVRLRDFAYAQVEVFSVTSGGWSSYARTKG